jgi:tRNA threonylcarbamoyl adenosine modification protein YeaZ
VTGPAIHLAIETSSSQGSLAIGADTSPIAILDLPPIKRQSLSLMSTTDRLLREHGFAASNLAVVSVSLGPGSFTGLRVATSTAKVLALSLGVKLIGIPTLDVLRDQHPESVVALNIKRGNAWSAGPGMKPAFRSTDELIATRNPLIADNLESADPVRPRAETLYHLAHARRLANAYDDPAGFAPLYLREPEAVTLWNQKLQST